MAPSTLRPRFHGDRLISFATAYDAQDEPTELVVPEDLSTLDDDALSALIDQFAAAGAALYAPDEGIIPDAAGMETMRQLAEGAETLRAEQAARVTAAEERATEAAALAAQIAPVVDEVTDPATDPEADPENPEDPEADPENPEADPEAPEVTDPEADPEETPEALAASGRRRGMNINLGAVRSRQSAPRPRQSASAAPSMRDFVTMAPNAPLHGGAPADFQMMAQSLSRQLASFPEAQYSQAARNNRHVRQQFGLATIRKPFDERLVISEQASDTDAEQVLAFAADESRLPGGSLVASGGWCAPSETLYDLFEIESTDGTYSLPEVNAARGSIRWTPGPTFASIFGEVGFSYTAAQDEAGEYGVDADGVGNDTAGSKPCYHLDCPDFSEESLSFDGLCITAGLLERRSYPELLARVLRGAQVAHDHKMSAHKLTAVAAGSTAVSLSADQVGTAAPVLTAIELQVEHIRSLHRTRMGLTMEAAFPSWVRGAIRSDLSRRLGVDMFDVPDSRINAWFAQRGINAQFLYGLSDISTTAASGMTAWPTTLDFLIYPAGTWVVGASDIITLDTVYDSTLLGMNDFTALFSEEGWMVLKRGHDSRKVTVPICADGATHAGVAIDCDGSAGA